MDNTYPLEQLSEHAFQFHTENGLRYNLDLESENMFYQNSQGEQIEILFFGFKLNKPFTLHHDSKTRNTIGLFVKDFLIDQKNDALLFRADNKRYDRLSGRQRGVGRFRIYKRLLKKFMMKYDQRAIILTNALFYGDPRTTDTDIIGIIINTASEDYTEIVRQFYSFCYKVTYVNTSE